MMEESGQTSPMKAQLCHIVDVAMRILLFEGNIERYR